MLAKHIATALLLGTFVAAVSLPGVVIAKDKEYKWGSIAVDIEKASTSPNYGIGGGDTEDEAKDFAMKYCKEDGGKACKVVVSYQDCGAYAASQKGGGFGINTTKKTAEAKAISGCDDDGCKIVVSDCN